ncbi:hypothetical protein TNIN_13181, partial [Trichonephila inaurata madagascariensis]
AKDGLDDGANIIGQKLLDLGSRSKIFFIIMPIYSTSKKNALCSLLYCEYT